MNVPSFLSVSALTGFYDNLRVYMLCWKTFVPPPLTEGCGINEYLTRHIKGTSLRICLANTNASTTAMMKEKHGWRHADTCGLKCLQSGFAVLCHRPWSQPLPPVSGLRCAPKLPVSHLLNGFNATSDLSLNTGSKSTCEL